MNGALSEWRRRLESLAAEIRAAPTPNRRKPQLDETRSRIDCENLLWLTYADLLIEQPAVAVTVGVSEVTLKEPVQSTRWARSVREITGEDPTVLRGQDSWLQLRSLTITSINKLIAASFNFDAYRGGDVTVIASHIRGGDAGPWGNGGDASITGGPGAVFQAAPSHWSGAPARLLLFLKTLPEHGLLVADLPTELRDVDMLNVLDHDSLIEFGRPEHWHEGSKFVVSQTWEFGSVTGPHKKPMAQFIAECLDWKGDMRIRPHIRLTAKGQVEASRLALLISLKATPDDAEKPAIDDATQASLTQFDTPVKLTDVAPIVGKRSDQIGNALKTAGCKYAVVNRWAYGEQSDLCKLYPKYRKHIKENET